MPANPRLVRIINSSLPVWITEGDDDRLDNNFWSPASFKAIEEVKRIERLGKVVLLRFNDIIVPEYLETGVPPDEEGRYGILEGHNLRPNYVLPIVTKYASDRGPELEEADILLGKDGEPGTFAIITQDLLDYDRDFAIGGHVYRIRLKDDFKDHAYFITLFLNSRLGQALVRKYIAGGTTPTIRTDDLKKIVVAIPTEGYNNLSEQARTILRELQVHVIRSITNITISGDLLQSLEAMELDVRLPINWAGGGRSDPHGYDQLVHPT